MARRVSWTNNSSGHLGTYVYRAPTLDPQNLPAPVATVAPVAQGETAEWIDDSGEYGCYAVQDYDGSGVSVLSEEVCVTDPLASAQVGDEVGGGIYAGTFAISSTIYHIIAAKESGQEFGIKWADSNVSSGATSADDGLANQQSVLNNFDYTNPRAMRHCRDYQGGGFSDWYLPSENELIHVYNGLSAHPEFISNKTSGNYTYSSTERSSSNVARTRFSDGTHSVGFGNKVATSYWTVPIRRVPA